MLIMQNILFLLHKIFYKSFAVYSGNTTLVDTFAIELEKLWTSVSLHNLKTVDVPIGDITQCKYFYAPLIFHVLHEG